MSKIKVNPAWVNAPYSVKFMVAASTMKKCNQLVKQMMAQSRRDWIRMVKGGKYPKGLSEAKR